MRPDVYKGDHCPPELREHISQMEDLMERSEYNHEGVPNKVAIDSWRSGLVSSFAQFEQYLREMGSKVYLIAVPLDFYGTDHKTVNPIYPEKRPSYTLFVAVNGKEAVQLRERLSISAEDNILRLLTTGVINV